MEGTTIMMKRTDFKIPKMDCPSEENLIRMKLESIQGIRKLEFNIPDRKLTVFHEGDLGPIENSIADLDLGGKVLGTEDARINAFEEDQDQKRLLWIVLIINFGFFLIEMTFGWISRSMGLVADSLDMMADAFVYGISLVAVGGTVIRKKRIARIAGYFQLTLAILGFAEVLRRFFTSDRIPDFGTMIIVSVLALIANGVCLYLLQRSGSKEEAHMKASMIFTSNDVIINSGVILAGLLVLWSKSNIPDLVIGIIVFIMVIKGAIRILRLGR